MKKSKLIPALAVAAVTAASLSLPATASADTYRHVERSVVRDDHRHDAPLRRVHDVEYRRIPVHHDHRHKHVHRHDYRPVERYVPRHEYRPVEYYVPRHDYRPVERYESRPDGDVRVRISYDLHL